MHILGEISLNISLILYLVFYLPQLLRNRDSNALNQLSIYFHALLMLAASTDLLYGFGTIDQWQYRMVSITTFTCVIWQHKQLLQHYKNNKAQIKLHIILLALVCWWLTIIYMLLHKDIGHNFFVAMGWVERVAYSCYGIPQIIKQMRNHSAIAISAAYLYMTLATAALDTTSAWCLGWPAPSIFGAPLALLINITLLIQIYISKKNAQQLSIIN